MQISYLRPTKVSACRSLKFYLVSILHSGLFLQLIQYIAAVAIYRPSLVLNDVPRVGLRGEAEGRGGLARPTSIEGGSAKGPPGIPLVTVSLESPPPVGLNLEPQEAPMMLAMKISVMVKMVLR